MALSRKIKELTEEYEVSLFTGYSGYEEEEAEGKVKESETTETDGGRVHPLREKAGEWAGRQMTEGNGLLFIGACGIAVRAVAPHLTDKLHDVPVLVMDDGGRYVIPILSGHVGGANELAKALAGKLGAIPVITTATDGNGKFAVDLFAGQNALNIKNKPGIAKVSAKVLDRKTVTFAIEPGHLPEGEALPEGVAQVPYPPKEPVDVVIAREPERFSAALFLSPREYVIGMGCRKGKGPKEIADFIHITLQEAGISPGQIYALASIDQKREEPGLLAWSRKHRIPFLTYTAEELGQVPGAFAKSAFVKATVGVDNVCERAALLACGAGGELILHKRAGDGMTIAVAKRKWRVTFHEY